MSVFRATIERPHRSANNKSEYSIGPVESLPLLKMSTGYRTSEAELSFINNKEKISDLLQSSSEILRQLIEFKRSHQTTFDILSPESAGPDAQVI